MLQETMAQTLAESGVAPLNVLVVEDSAADANLIRMVLADTGLCKQLLVVSDGEDALDVLRRTGRFEDQIRPDLIFLDLNLPRKDGLDVLSEIRTDASLRRIPVVVLTSSSNPDDIGAAYDRGANLYCKKPFELDELERLLSHIVKTWYNFACLPPQEKASL
jgi:two-component system, chemotaxis family, response regulator Rcp1